ncbi:MAG: 50S ribosomal protein L28 [Candidatus Phytoplasma sp. TWB_XP]
MSKCYIDEKTTLFGNRRRHTMNATKRIWKANLQNVKIVDENGKIQKLKITHKNIA